MKNRPIGFTLIELLVTIAIISVLAAILFPVFSAAREQARSTACLSNVRQIASAQIMYSSDFDENLVSYQLAHYTDPTELQVANCWIGTLQPYLKNTDILFCPSFDESSIARAMDEPTCDGNGSPGSASAGYIPPNKYLSHYGAGLHLSFGSCVRDDPYAYFAGSGWENAYYVGLGINGQAIFFNQPLAGIVEPARTAVSGDGATLILADQSAVAVLLGCEGQYRHKGSGVNLGFVDGHAKYFNGDPERYQSQDENGCWYETYFTANR